MPLDPSGLSATLAANFAAPVPSYAGCAQQWADAMEAYASEIVPPSTTVSAAAGTLVGALATAFATPAAAPGMEAAFAAFALTVSGGMAPGFVGTPPGGPVGFAAQFLIKPPSHADAGAQISALIQAWMITGSSTPSGGGAPSPWS